MCAKKLPLKIEQEEQVENLLQLDMNWNITSVHIRRYILVSLFHWKDPDRERMIRKNWTP